jgi:hypothetical protein
MSAAQASQLVVSFTPAEQIEWEQLEPPPDPPLPPEPPPHDWPHTELTSPTQTESHEVLQQ